MLFEEVIGEETRTVLYIVGAGARHLPFLGFLIHFSIGFYRELGERRIAATVSS